MFKNPWITLLSVVIAVVLVAGTAATLQTTVAKTHKLEQQK